VLLGHIAVRVLALGSLVRCCLLFKGRGLLQVQVQQTSGEFRPGSWEGDWGARRPLNQNEAIFAMRL
jgi:hypothetical protein